MALAMGMPVAITMGTKKYVMVVPMPLVMGMPVAFIMGMKKNTFGYGEISSDMYCVQQCDIEKSKVKSFELETKG